MDAWEQQDKLIPGDDVPYERLGASVDVDEDTAVVGAPAAEQGFAFVFEREASSWTHTDTLSADEVVIEDQARGDRFGFDVAIQGDRILVGAELADTASVEQTGAVYVFDYDGTQWSQVDRLLSDTPGQFDRFGKAVDIHGATIAVGESSDGAQDTGTVHVFEDTGSGIDRVTTLQADPVEEDAGLGSSLAVHAGTILAGAPGGSTGAAYVFEDTGTWAQIQQLTPSETGSSFGRDVDLHGDTAVVGDHTESGIFFARGSAYVFEHDGSSWQQSEKFAPAKDAEQFGDAVATNGDTVAVGATFGGPDGTGEVLLYTKDGSTWTEADAVQGTPSGPIAGFGSALSLDATTLLAGAPADSTQGGFISGSAFAFVDCSHDSEASQAIHDHGSGTLQEAGGSDAADVVHEQACYVLE